MNKLRRKMISIVFAAVMMVFILMTGLIIAAVHIYTTKQADQMTELMSLNKGRMPHGIHRKVDVNIKMSETETEEGEEYHLSTELFEISSEDKRAYPMGYDEEMAFKTRYFIVNLDGDQVKSVDTSHIAAVDETEACNIMKQILAKGNTIGYIEHFRYRLVENDDGKFAIFLDRTDSFRLLEVVALLMSLVSVFFTFSITIVFGILSKKVVKPFEENSKRQKQFITDASHELKTPLAIISANAEVLEYKNGKNDWIQNIIDQTKAMGKLINQLLVLSKLEEVGDDLILEEVELSSIVKEITDSLREIASQKKASMSVEIPGELAIMAGNDQMNQLISILVENAAKYVSDEGEIKVRLKKNSRYACLDVYNMAEMDPQIDYNRLFDRFYRTDQSRSSQTGGHGIGLSIAKKIVTQYGGRISARAEKNGICFKVELPVNARGNRRAVSEKRHKV